MFGMGTGVTPRLNGKYLGDLDAETRKNVCPVEFLIRGQHSDVLEGAIYRHTLRAGINDPDEANTRLQVNFDFARDFGGGCAMVVRYLL